MNDRFYIENTPLDGLCILQRKPVGDSRGYLERLFCSEDLLVHTQGKKIVQINHTFTKDRGTVRGLHFQSPPHAEIKFVSCLRGQVFDVAVDMRDNSPTFLHWFALMLSADNFKTLLIPEGFAHGFQTQSDECEMLYFHTKAYHSGAECGVHALDPKLAIPWPLPVVGLSSRDSAHSFLSNDFTGVT